MSEDIRQPELNALEAALTALKPATGGLDREQLMFRAGQASMRRPRIFWPSVSGVLAVVIAVLSGLLVSRPTIVQVVHVPAPRPEPAPVMVQQESTEPESPAPPPRWEPNEPRTVRSDYLRQREELLSGKVTQAMPPTYLAPNNLTLDQMLEMPVHSLDPVSRSRLQHAFPKTGGPL